VNSTLKIRTPEAITLIEKIEAEIKKKARGVKSQTKVAETAQTAGETLMASQLRSWPTSRLKETNTPAA
jgi:hypothetical protein